MRLFEMTPEGDTVAEILDSVHAARVHARQRGPDRQRAGRDDELVEPLLRLDAALDVARGHGARVEVDGDHLGTDPNVETVAPVLFGRARDELVGFVDHPRDEIRQSARRGTT